MKPAIPIASQKLILGALIIAFILITMVAVPNLIYRQLKLPLISGNDLHIRWLLNGEHFFVASSPHKKFSNPLMRTNWELHWLGNGYDFFRRNKRQGTFRIFCIGGSTTRGWPFHERLSYPRLLSLYLQDLLPEKRTEVINAGFMGSDSFSDIPLIKEILNYQPDLLLIYEGRNDAYDLPLHIGSRHRLLRFHAWLLRHVRLYGFLSLLNRKPKEFITGKKFDHAKAIREFAERNFVRQDHNLRLRLEENLTGIIKMAEKRHCAIALLTQVVSPEEERNGSVATRINSWIRELALRHQVSLIDIDKSFRDSGISHEKLILPVSVHPDLAGYILMAKIVCKELSEGGAIAPKHEWNWGNLKSDPQYLRQIGITPDFLSQVYAERVGSMFKAMDMQSLAQTYYMRAKVYARNKKLSL